MIKQRKNSRTDTSVWLYRSIKRLVFRIPDVFLYLNYNKLKLFFMKGGLTYD